MPKIKGCFIIIKESVLQEDLKSQMYMHLLIQLQNNMKQKLTENKVEMAFSMNLSVIVRRQNAFKSKKQTNKLIVR